MKRAGLVFMLVIACVGLLLAALQSAAPPQKPLSPWFPAGSLLYIEAKDFAALLSDWNASPEKRVWAEGGNYEVFSQSRLFLRLKGAGDQFSAAAGLPPDMNFLKQVAGEHSALALYDIGNLQFLYVTYLPSARSMQTTLWQSRARFEPRNAGGTNFYVRRDPESQKQVAFAISGDYLLLATREDLLAAALQLIAGAKDRSVEAETWWSQPVSAAGPAGDLRMVLNLQKLVPGPYFRTYWVQQNITDMGQYAAAVTDMFRSGREYREERVLIADNPGTMPAGPAQAAAEVARLVPQNAGLYEAKAAPTPAQALDLLETKLLAPHSGQAPASQTAPQVQLTSGETGGASDLETRIDQPSLQRTAASSTLPLQHLLEQSPLLASLEVQSSERDRSGVFVRIHSAVALVSSSEWNVANVQRTISDLVAPSLTASGIGIAWQQKSGYQQLDGLWTLTLAVRGKYVIVADDPLLMESMLANFNRPVEKSAVLLAGFNHSRERDNFSRFTGLLDQANVQQRFPGQGRQQPFFSGNIASLSGALSQVASEKIVSRIDGTKTLQTVTYELQ